MAPSIKDSPRTLFSPGNQNQINETSSMESSMEKTLEDESYTLPPDSSTKQYLPVASFTKNSIFKNTMKIGSSGSMAMGEFVIHREDLNSHTLQDTNYNNNQNHFNNNNRNNVNGNGNEANGNSTSGSTVIVRGEEVGIVIVVLLLWVGAIILFFNRWGKIRMLEPYQPKFCENHRPSCPMADVTSISNYPRTYSKFNLSTDMLGSPHFAKCNYHGIPSNEPGMVGYGVSMAGSSLGVPGLMRVPSRPRQNSVFVTSPHSGITVLGGGLFKTTSRKTKSAIDLSNLVLSEEFLQNVKRNSKNSITQL